MTRKLYIPPLGDEITLAEDWTFNLYNEHRNSTLVDVMNVTFPEVDYYKRQHQYKPVTLPAGSVLKVDRIYIKKGQDAFNSVTFYLKGHSRPGYVWTGHAGRTYKMPKRSVRFWAKLADANKIVMEEA